MQLFVIQAQFMVNMAGKNISLEGNIISEKRAYISVCSSNNFYCVVYGR